MPHTLADWRWTSVYRRRSNLSTLALLAPTCGAGGNSVSNAVEPQGVLAGRQGGRMWRARVCVSPLNVLRGRAYVIVRA